MFNPLSKAFASDNEGPNKLITQNKNSHEKDKEKFFGNKNKINKPKIPKNFGKKKFKYTIDEENDTNMILEQEFENFNKTEMRSTNNINLRLLSHDTVLWKKINIFLLQIKVNENKTYKEDNINENNNKTLDYLYKLTNNSKEFRQSYEINNEKDIKQIIIKYISQFSYKIKLLIIYLENNNNIFDEEKNFVNDTKNEINCINCNDEDLNDSGFKKEIFIDLFSCNEINVPFYIITKKYLYAKLFNKKMNYIFMSNDFLSDKKVKVLLFHDNKKISPKNSNNNFEIEKNKINNDEPITITTRGFLPEFKDTKITIEGSTSSTLSLSSDEDYLDTSVIYTKNGIGILQFNINP